MDLNYICDAAHTHSLAIHGLFVWLVGWLVSRRPLQQPGYIAEGPQDSV